MLEFDYEHIISRLETLEKQNRKLKTGMILFGVLLTSFIFLGAGSDDVYQYSGSFLVKDKYGNIRAMLGHLDRAGRLHIGRLEHLTEGYKPDLRNSVGAIGGDDAGVIYACNDRSSVVFMGGTGKSSNAGYLQLSDADGKSRIFLGIGSEGTPVMQFYDSNGKVVRSLP